MTHDNDFANDATSHGLDHRAEQHSRAEQYQRGDAQHRRVEQHNQDEQYQRGDAQHHQGETHVPKESELGELSGSGAPLDSDALSPYDYITAHNISIGFPHTTEEGWREGVEAKEKFRPTPSSLLRVEMWWPFEHPDPSEEDIARLADFLTSNNLRLIAMNLWAGDMAAGERGVLHREPLPSSHIDAVARIHELTGVQKFNLLVGRRGEDADSWEVQRERFVRAAIAVYLATGGMVLVENMSGIEDYPIKRVREAFDLSDEVRRVLHEGDPKDYGLDPDDPELIEAVANSSSGVLFDAYHFLTNWEAKIETNEAWVLTPGDVIEVEDFNGAGEGREEERDDSDFEFEEHRPTQEVGGDEVENLLECQMGCMISWRHFSHAQIAAWPDRGDPTRYIDQFLDIVEALRFDARRTMDLVELEIVGEWLPEPQ